MKRIIIVGATSGIGREIAQGYLAADCRIGIAGRRIDALKEFQATAPDKIAIRQIDVTAEDAADALLQLIEKTGGMDLFLLSSGIGSQNMNLNPEIEIDTAKTNVVGFTRMVDTAFNYFKQQGKGHLAVISSIAGTKGLGAAPAYSATKCFQNTYIEALSQLSHMEKLHIRFTDIRPGFVATALLKDGNYPLLMKPGKVAGHIIRALERQRRIAIIDWRYAILVFFWRLIPGGIWERLPIRNNKH